MSSDDAPQTPHYKSSSTSFADVFKTLGVGRPKSHSPVSVQESSSDSLSHTTEARGSNRMVLGLESMHRGSVVSNSSDPHGGLDFESSLRNLTQRQSLVLAIEEAENVAKGLSCLPAEQSVVLWEAAEYLLHHENPEAQRSAARLLEAISARQDLSPSARHLVYESIARPTDAEVIASRVQSLISLSDHGRKLDFTTDSVLHVITAWIVPLYGLIASGRSKAKKGKSPKSTALTHEETALGELFQFAVDLVTLQRKPPTKEDIEFLLEETITICKRTSVAGDIKDSLAIFDAVILYADVPDVSFVPLLEVLCSIHASVKPLSGPTSRAVRSLAKSRRQEEMANTLHEFLKEGCGPESHRNMNVVRGALYLFSDLFRAYGQPGMPTISFEQLIESLEIVARNDDGRIDSDILDLCLNILEGDFISVALKSDWAKFAPQKGTHDDTKSSILANMIRIAAVLESFWDLLGQEQKQHAVRFLAECFQHIDPSQSELIIKMAREDKTCHPGGDDSDWIQHTKNLIERFIQPRKQSSDIRILALDTIKEAIVGHEALLFSEEHNIMNLLLQDFAAEHDLLFLESLVSFITEPAIHNSDDGTFKQIIDTISTPMKHDLVKDEHSEISPIYTPSSRRTSTSTTELTLANVCAVGLVKLMLRALNSSATKSVIIYEALLRIAQSPNRPTDARLTVLKLLFRLRCDSAGSVSVISTSEGDFLMNVLGRNVEVGHKMRAPSDSPIKESQPENIPPLPNGKLPGKDLPPSLLSKSIQRHGSLSARTSKLTPPSSPEQPPGESSPLVFAHTQTEAMSPVVESAPAQVGVLKVNMWLEIVISLLQRETDWDVYSYVLTHLGPQLSNKEFFASSIPQIKLLRSILCDQVKNETFHEPPGLTGLKKSDVAACIFDALCMLISYHEHFAKSEEDDLVRAFMIGIIGSWGATSRGCIQALSLCCYEIPASVTKSLNGILDKMAKVITMSNLAVHILEFLALLARLPEVFSNLREDEIRPVFGICIRLLQTSREQRSKPSDSSPTTRASQQNQNRLSVGSRELTSPVNSVDLAENAPQEAMSSYMMTLTYHVMIIWYLSLRLQDRPKHVNWITSRLIYHDEHGKEVVEEQSQVFIDLMQRVAFSDLGDTVPFETFPPTPEHGSVVKKSWVVGLSIITVETATTSGLTQVTKRQASGTTYIEYHQRTAPVLPHQVPLPSNDTIHGEPRTAVLPSHIMLQMTTSAFPTPTVMQPIPVPEDDITRRAIASFDRTDIVDGHRIGIVYIDNGQTKEAEILANTGGSADYGYFLSGLGTRVSLRNAQFNTQGLYADTDGEETIAWRDRVTEIVYHVATMMPTDLERDPACINKKRNIGNNFVTIVFNRSNLPFDFDTIPSEFNFINIVITPSSRIAYDENGVIRGQMDPESQCYSVRVISKPGFPEVSPAATPKIVSGKKLAAFVRILAVNASVFSLVWNNKGAELHSSWRTRLREIKKVRERALTMQAQGAEAAEGAYPTQRRNTKANIFSEELPVRAAPIQTDFAAEWNAASETNILQNLDFSRWSR
ncbi:hypothetical protein N7470_007606 [Penicillium chermesinum]|nr:hypothetical protein N7470_007606 [Penicillium chermesinum]